MAFTGAISGLFSCGRARKPETREEVDAAAGTSGEGGTTRADPEFATPNRIDATTNVTDKEYNNEQNSAPSQLSAPRFSEELFPFAAVHPVPAVPEPAPAEPASPPPPKLEHVPEERPQRKNERKQSSDVASKAAKGTQIEHRILVTSVVKPDTKDAAPELKVEHVETSVTEAAPVTKVPEVTPTVALEKAPVESEVVKKAEDEVPAPVVEVAPEQSSEAIATPAAESQATAPVVGVVEADSAPKPIEVQQPASSSQDEPSSISQPEAVPEPQETAPVVSVVEEVKLEEEPAVVEKAEKPVPRTATTLLSLPLEVRKVIYSHMTEAAPIRMCRHDDPALTDPEKAASNPPRQFYAFTQVCSQLRREFLPIYEQRTKHIIDLWTQRTSLTKIDSLKGDVAMDIDAACFDMQPIDLLPLIRYLARSGRTNVRFASTEGVVFKSIESTVEQLNKLLPSQHKNSAWLAAVNGPVKRIDLHLFPHDDIRQYYRFRGAEPMLRIVYPSAVIESWMKQSHKCGEEYEEYISKVGLEELEMHIVVGHASRRKTNEGRMPLNWRLSYAGSRLSMEQAVRISGTFSRGSGTFSRG